MSQRVVLAAALAGAATVLTGVVAVTAAPAAAPACSVDYRVNQWPGGFTAEVAVTNATGAALSSWRVTWTFDGGQRITGSWNTALTQTGNAVTAANAAYNGSVGVGGTVRFGIQGTFSGANPAPVDFALNGQSCQDSPPTTTTPTTPTTTTTTPPPGCPAGSLCEDWEAQSGTPGGRWAVTYPNCQGTGTAAIDPAAGRGGGKAVRIDGGGGYCNHVFVGTALDGMTHGRFYVRHDTALPAAHVTFMAMRDAVEGKDLRMGGQNAAMQWNRESDDATLPEQSPSGVALSRPLPVDRWTCVEFAVEGGDIRTWVDGTLVTGLVADGVQTHDVDGQWLRGKPSWRPNLTDFRIGWESYGGDTDTLVFDDIVLAPTRVGC
ncbi:cellulose-binding domain-containing protein [Actinokineospora sp. UTMC 2448]|uniref:cellulose-binding domain-containing protein n=1 Tax=Actinokineospora sp. UTMC 2448 TaxID=2268449 RepID=UPI0021640B77|nr:cellulose-binding domain-containing protein [Actinokineospora sp. UTMC 2448]